MVVGNGQLSGLISFQPLLISLCLNSRWCVHKTEVDSQCHLFFKMTLFTEVYTENMKIQVNDWKGTIEEMVVTRATNGIWIITRKLIFAAAV